MKKRILSLFVMMCMLLASVPVIVSAETSGTLTDSGTFDVATGLSWAIYDGTKLVISKTGEGTGVMPDYAGSNDKPWETYRAAITSVVFDEGVTYIGARAVQEHRAVTTVTMADTVTSMGQWVFNACDNLTSIKLSKNLALVSDNTFYNAKALKSITIPYSTSLVVKSFRRAAADLVVNVYTNSNAYTWAASSGVEGKTPTVEITSNSSAQLSYNVLPLEGNVTDDGSIKWSIMNGVLTISGTGAMPDNYDDTTYLTRPWQDYVSIIAKVVIGDGITSIGNKTFQLMPNMTEFVMADTVTSMGTYMFNGCSNLTKVTLSENLAQIPNGTFNAAAKLTSLEIPFKTAVINESDSKSSFRGVNKALNLIVYEGSSAYSWAKSSGEDGVTPIVKKLNATLTYTVKEVTTSGNVIADGSIKWEFKNSVLTISGIGAMPNWHTTAGLESDPYYYTNRGWHDYAGSITKVVIGEGITAVGKYSFFGCNKLAEVEFEATTTLKTIDEYSFANTILSEVSVPASVMNIEANAFRASSETNEDTHTLEKIIVNGDYTLFTTNTNSQSALNRQSKVVIYCNYGSEAKDFAKSTGIEYRLMDTDYNVADFDTTENAANILNSTDAAITATIIFASYEGDAVKEISLVKDVTLNVGMNTVPASDDFDVLDSVNVYMLDNMNTLKPIGRQYIKNRIWMIGDSIMASWGTGRFPQEGWGEAFKKVVTSDLVVNNVAISGRRAENFYNNDWPSILSEVRNGDFVIVSFLHNDYCWVADSSKNNGHYQDAEYINTYKSSLEKFVDDCEAKGAQIILVVPPNRGTADNFHDNLVEDVNVGDYSAIIPAVAEEKGVPCVNIHAWTLANNTDSNFVDSIYLSKGYLEGLVDDGVVTEADLDKHTNSNIKNNRDDKTHISVNGCEAIAEYVAAQLKTMNTGIETFLK